MPAINLARLIPVPLREAWASESGDFTPWLAHEENLKLLGGAIGVELELDQQEVFVGPYRADILCKELESNQRVVIENQIEDTDHSHLGQILTYAAGLDAGILIWISQKFTEEHRAALDWLNERAKGGAGFFGVEIELYRIGDSPPAPRFNVVSKPNDFSNRLKQTVQNGGLSEAEQLRSKYWTALVGALKTAGADIRPNAVAMNPWLSVQAPMPGYRAGFEISGRDRFIGTYFGAYSAENIEILRRLQRDHKKEIEQEIGEKVEWPGSEESKRFWVAPWKDADPRDEKDWGRQHEWLGRTLEKLIDVMTKHLAAQSSLR